MSAQRVPGRLFPPLDQKLALRADHWSGGAARVATRLGLQAKSFDLAAAGFSDAVGRDISGDSVARLTEGWGRRVAEQRSAEAERANRPGAAGRTAGAASAARSGAHHDASQHFDGWGDDAGARGRLEGGQGRGDLGSACATRPAHGRPPSPAAGTPTRWSNLSQHSYQAGLWDADTMALYQYAEGLRRGLDYCPKRSSVNDGALWIKRITDTNFPGVPQIVDWSHATEHLWGVANAVHGERTAAAKQWVEPQLDRLWTRSSRPSGRRPWINSTCSNPAGPTLSKKRPTTSAPIKSACATTTSAPRVTRSAAARSKAPPTPSSIIVCGGLGGAGRAIMARPCWPACVSFTVDALSMPGTISPTN